MGAADLALPSLPPSQECGQGGWRKKKEEREMDGETE